MALEALEKEWSSVTDDYHKMEKIHEEYVQKMRQMGTLQATSTKSLKHHNYLMKGLKDAIEKAEKEVNAMGDQEAETNGDSEKDKAMMKLAKLKQDIELARVKLRDMQSELPAQNNGFYLNLILGSNLNVSLLTKSERFKYKQEYEEFKWKITIVIAVLTIISYFFPFRVLDSLACFVMVWYYCTLTIRESVLRVNGSKIKGWWLTHHYLSVAVPGIVLTWKDGACYQQFRPYFLFFVFYISLVQLAQNQYQSGCLRRLHALGQGHQMDITVEGFMSWQFKGLTFLLPFLMSGYFFQMFLAYKLSTFINYEYCDGLWQVWALGILLGVIASGNIFTTSLVCLKRFKATPSYANIIALTRKYNSRNRLRQTLSDEIRGAAKQMEQKLE